jgi:hypothetical protein
MALPKLLQRKPNVPPANNSQPGAIPQDVGLTKEQGSSRGLIYRELVPQLVGRYQYLLMYDRMMRTDVSVSVALRSAKSPILGADWYFEPASDDQQDLDIAEFVEHNLTEAITSPWIVNLSRILRNFQEGTSIFELVFQQADWRPQRKGANTKTYTMLSKLGFRPLITIQQIDVDDNGGPVQIIQNAIDSKGEANQVTIPIDKAIMFPIGDTDDWYGQSLLRSSYQHWYYKTYLYKIDAIQKERHGIGIPAGKLPPGWNQENKEAMKQLVSNLRTNEKAEAVLPPGYEVEFLKPNGNLVDVLKSAGYHDVMIMLNFLAEFMMLGLESSGSGGGRATGAAQLDIFYKSLLGYANLICDNFNMYLIPKLVQYNFDTDQYPEMKVRNVGQTKDLQQLAAALASVTNTELITPDISTEQWTREVFDMPRKIEDRPEFAPTQVREIFNVSEQEATIPGVTQGAPPSTQIKATNGANPAKTGITGGGNSGKSTTQP